MSSAKLAGPGRGRLRGRDFRPGEPAGNRLIKVRDCHLDTISLCRRLGTAPSASGASTRRKVGPCRFAASGAGKSTWAVGWVKNTEFPVKSFHPRDPTQQPIRSKKQED